MLVVETGRVAALRISEQGARVLLGQVGPGEIVGEFAALDGRPRSAWAVASVPVTGVMLTVGDVEGFLLDEPRLMLGLLVGMTAKLRGANRLAEDRAPHDGAMRLARCLLRLAEDWGEVRADGTVRLGQRFSQGELGEIAGLTRPNVNRHLRAWTAQGIVATEAGRLAILAPDRLSAIAAGPETG